MAGVLHTSRINTVRGIVGNDKWIKMVNFLNSLMKCERWIDQHSASVEQRKNLILNSLSNAMSCWSIHLSHFISDDFDSADPRSVQDACHTWTQLNDLAVHELVLVAQWIEHQSGVRDFRVRFLSRTQIVFLVSLVSWWSIQHSSWRLRWYWQLPCISTFMVILGKRSFLLARLLV